uniref:Uncharacterized protein n=1 Tax=Rhizophora mucronata TaxID=61149 RepID=A0A2P2IPP9_RHIMU
MVNYSPLVRKPVFKLSIC